MPYRIPNTEFYANTENAEFRREIIRLCARLVGDRGDDYKRRLKRVLNDASAELSRQLPSLCIHHEDEDRDVVMVSDGDGGEQCPECGSIPVAVIGFRTGVE